MLIRIVVGFNIVLKNVPSLTKYQYHTGYQETTSASEDI